MYIISCGNENEIVMEPETGYVPNNPLFGLPPAQLDKDCISSCDGDDCGNCESAFPLATSEFDCGSCLDHSNLIGPPTQLSQSNPGSNIYWSEDMGSIPGLPPLDLVEPLPSLFPFSPCGVPYNRNERPHDVADVLLSLKHAVLKPSPEPSSQQLSHYNGSSGGPVAGLSGSGSGGPHQASLSYTVHPHPQMLVPSANHQSHHHHHHHLHQPASSMTNYYDSNGQYGATVSAPPPPPPLYPSMSVNVSMNMTMHHGYGAEPSLQCSQGDNFLQWTPPAPNSSQMNLYPPLVGSPQHYPNSATYSITADFRPPTSSSSPSSHLLNSYPPPHHQNLFDPFHSRSSVSPDSIAQRNGYYGTPVMNTTSPSPHLLNALHKSPHFNGASPPDCVLNNSGYDENHHGMPVLLESMTNGELQGGMGGGGGASIKIRQSLKSLRFDDDEEEGEEDSRDSCSESKPNLCRLCGKTYARPSTLKTHLRTHSGERPYRCPDCNKSFSQAANLTAHVRTHTGQKPFRCPICQRQFSQSSSVTTHMRTHSGERPYRCRACKKSFSDSSTLTKHLRIHSGEKPYQCKLCLLRFSQSGNLNRHMRVHGTNGNGGGGGVAGVAT